MCNGTMAFAIPLKKGVPKSSSMIVPCMVNISLYCSGLSTTCRPGSHSSRRITSAIIPARRNQMKVVTM